MHQTDESTPVQDLQTLTAIYRRIIEKYFNQTLNRGVAS
jgi:acetylornithine deacetylase/succinyl-diaminopimelate desuccinylase-like protein